jgi:hypothetical protein
MNRKHSPRKMFQECAEFPLFSEVLPTRASSILGKRRRECAQLDVPARGERILTDRAVVSKNNFHAPFIAADYWEPGADISPRLIIRDTKSGMPMSV